MSNRKASIPSRRYATHVTLVLGLGCSQVTAIVDAVVWSESELKEGGGDPGFYHSKASGSLRMKRDRSEVFLGMGDEDATLSYGGE